MPNYKLTYFNLKGRAELPRLLFAEAGVTFQDVRIEFADWPKHKPNTPFGKLPVLEIDGSPLPESGAIVHYLAREFKLDGENNLQSAYAEMVHSAINDAFSTFPFFEKDEKKKEELMKKCLDEKLRPTFRRFEEKYTEKLNKHKKEKKNDKCFFIGKKLTFADLALMDAKMNLEEIGDKNKEIRQFLNDFPNLNDLVERTKSRPKIKAWIDSHQKPKPQKPEQTKF